MIGITATAPFRNRKGYVVSATMLVLMGCMVVLSACGGEDTAPRSRAATPPAATVLAFTPTTGGIGTIVTVTGTNFSTTQSVTIGGAPAIVLSQSGSALTALVMPGAVTGPVQVTRASGILTSSGLFTVATPGVPTTQQGPKLIGTGAAVGLVQQGYSVALSADGATALVGSPADDANTGAAWVFTRTGGIWTQQGTKRVGTGAVGAAEQGTSVVLSADGTTALVGGPADDAGLGAIWVFAP
jgi:IPT/TIG domain